VLPFGMHSTTANNLLKIDFLYFLVFVLLSFYMGNFRIVDMCIFKSSGLFLSTSVNPTKIYSLSGK
jgi:uncharacterized membrane protein YtjA (UPF0391 family)